MNKNEILQKIKALELDEQRALYMIADEHTPFSHCHQLVGALFQISDAIIKLKNIVNEITKQEGDDE